MRLREVEGTTEEKLEASTLGHLLGMVGTNALDNALREVEGMVEDKVEDCKLEILLQLIDSNALEEVGDSAMGEGLVDNDALRNNALGEVEGDVEGERGGCAIELLI